jgi:hypothetical protein
VGDPLYVTGGIPCSHRTSSTDKCGLCERAPNWDVKAEEHEAMTGQLGLDANCAERPPLPTDGGYHLHAFRLRIAHPRTGEELELVAPPPPMLKAIGE